MEVRLHHTYNYTIKVSTKHLKILISCIGEQVLLLIDYSKQEDETESEV